MSSVFKKIPIEDALMLGAIRVARFFVGILPYRASLAVGTLLGDLGYLLTKRRKVMMKNLRSVFAAQKSPQELKVIARESFRNLARSGIELLRAPLMDRAFAEKHVRVVGREKVDLALKEGKGVIFLTGHFGSWEMLNIAAGLYAYPMTSLARVQKHPRTDAYLNDLRRSTGNQIIYKGMPVREILRALKQGRIVGILSDQDGGRNGAFVRFFDRLSSYPKGVAAFALRTGAPIFPAFIVRESVDTHRIEVEGPLAVPSMDLSYDDQEKYFLSQFARILEEKVRKNPTEWLWAHRRWKSSPDRHILILSDGKAGHLNQSKAFYETIHHQRHTVGAPEGTTHLKVIDVKFQSKNAEKFFKIFMRVCAGRVSWMRILAKKFLTPASYREIIEAYADVVISTGSSVAGVNLWIAAENAAKSAVIMDPGFGLKRFDAVIAPRHDHLPKRKNIHETEGALTGVTEEILRAEALKLRSRLALDGQKKVVGFLVGGDTSEIHFDRDQFLKIVDGLEQALQNKNLTLLITTSRRTPVWVEDLLRERFYSSEHCPLLVIANQENPPGIVRGILGCADTVVVSGESISMVSEAISAGKPVLVVEPFDKKSMKRKCRDFLDQLEKKGLVLRTPSDNVYNQLQSCFGGRVNPVFISEKKDEDVLLLAAQRISQ